MCRLFNNLERDLSSFGSFTSFFIEELLSGLLQILMSLYYLLVEETVQKHPVLQGIALDENLKEMNKGIILLFKMFNELFNIKRYQFMILSYYKQCCKPLLFL